MKGSAWSGRFCRQSVSPVSLLPFLGIRVLAGVHYLPFPPSLSLSLPLSLSPLVSIPPRAPTEQSGVDK